jgi:hypothetical protein
MAFITRDIEAVEAVQAIQQTLDISGTTNMNWFSYQNKGWHIL